MFCQALGVIFFGGGLQNGGGRDASGQPVRTEHETVFLQKRQLRKLNLGIERDAQGAGDHVSLRRTFGFLFRHQTLPDLLVDPGVVGGQRLNGSSADQIESAVSEMSDGQHGTGHPRRHDGGPHARTLRPKKGLLQDHFVRETDRGAQSICVRRDGVIIAADDRQGWVLARMEKMILNRLGRRVARNFSGVVPT